MHAIADQLLFSATDLSNFLACPHLSLLDRRTALGGLKPPKYDDPALEVLWQRGLLHEQNYLAGLKRAGKHVVEIEQPDRAAPYHDRWTAFAARTFAAIGSGADVIYQAGLIDGQWLGKPDFLIRVATPSDLGDWSYEVVDTKLAREAKGGALLQILLYADLLARAQGAMPEFVHLALGGPDAPMQQFRVADYMAYFRSVRARFLAAMAHAADPPVAAEPVEHCDICAWKSVCAQERRDVDHLSLVAGITRAQRRALVDHGTTTLESLATLDPQRSATIDGISNAAFARIRNQAAIQLEGRRTNQHLHELLVPVEPSHGLAALPTPSPGDLFFDIEGDQYALTHGLEYLFGFVDRDGNYEGWWGLDRDAERRNFERFIDFVMARLERSPDLHIYHYAPYEPSALKRLMGRYATREDEVDRLLRGRVLVDLYRVVKQGLRASVESYSIKKLEPFYGYTRDVDLRTASGALASFEAWLELGGERADVPGTAQRTLLDEIQGYNRDDCVSTLQLNGWLEKLRAAAVSTSGEFGRPVAPDGDASEALQERNEEIDALVVRLTADVPADPAERTEAQHARWLAAQLLEFHRREDKSTWWEYFRCLDLSDDEFIEDRATLGGLDYVGVVDTIARSHVHRYRFPPQDHGFRIGKSVQDPATEKSPGTIIAIDDVACTIDLKRSKASTVPHPRALVLNDHINNSVLRDSIMRVGHAIAEHGLTDACPFGAAVDLLLRRAPRAGQTPGADLMRAGESPLAAAVRLVDTLDCTVLPIQGPPGAGKTYTAARMIVRALQAGKRVGITAQSHKVIAHLLSEVCRASAEVGHDVHGMQKADDDDLCDDERIVAGDNQAVFEALASGVVRLAAGTAWLWSRPDMVGAVDLLVIDEAGQFSLANTIAVAPAARSLVLVGDPRQLEQPQQGVHPPGADVTALDHVLGGTHTVAPDRGLFLAQTWRLHPAICAFTSELFYDNRLRARAGLEHQRIGRGAGALLGSGLRFVPVTHFGNQSDSPEEVLAVVGIVDALLAGGAVWTDADGKARPLTIGDVLIVAPYNAQVGALRARLPEGARVGTVDKFQGQEAPIVICSMTTSSAEDAPRGMEFVYSPNRLNVATSRARCLAIVVASPLLFAADCRTPEQMRLANAFCRFAEMADVLDVRSLVVVGQHKAPAAPSS